MIRAKMMPGMPRLGVMHASAVVKVSRDKLVSALRDAAAAMPENLRLHLEELKGKMETMAEVMGAAEMGSMEEEAPEWLMHLEDTAYGIWDMVDELQLQSNEGAPVLAAVRRPSCLPIAIAREERIMVTTMSKAIENLDLLQQRLQSDLGFRRDENTSGKLEQSVDDAHHPGGTASSFDEEEDFIVDREDLKSYIVDYILLSRDSSGLITIDGMGGMGKTTLAKMVFCDTGITRDYARAWVNVGAEEFDLKKIGNSILSQLSNKGEHQDTSDVELIMKRLDKLLGGGNKILVVLDDVRPEHASDLKRMLGGAWKIEGGKAIVIVTARRILDFAGLPRLQGACRVGPISFDGSLRLVQRKLGFDTTTTDDATLELMYMIAGKCDGIPLAIHALGYALRSKTPEEIKSVIDSDIWVEYGYEPFGSLTLPLLLSYQCMPPNLRLCFAYCATFPRGHSIRKDDLVHHWTALQLIEPSDKLSTMQLANKYIGMLLGMSFLQPSMPPSDDRSAMHFTLHDTIYDLAVTASSGKLINLNSTYSYQSFSEKNSYRYACLANFDVSALNLSGISSAQLSVLLFHGCRTNKQLSDDLFSPAKYLRVLDLRDFCLQKLPNSICQLRQLRYLNLSGCSSLVNLPDSFGNLLNLGHIDLSGCSRLLELPASFGNLRNVVHIDLSGCIGLKALPPESFGLLKRLEHFDLSSCSCLEGIPYFVNGLTNLQYLNLSHPCCYLAKHRFHLNALKDIWVKLINLRYLNLSMCLNPMFCYLPEKERIEYIESISCLHKLEHLDLSHNIFLSDVPESLGQLGELQTLNLSGCVRLKRIDKWMGERNCPKKFLVVSNCLGLERYQFAVRTDGGGKRSNLAQLKDVSCKEVEISCLEKVISTEEAQSIGLTEKKKLQKLTLVWSAGRDDVSFRDQDLLAELVPPKNLQCFELHGYSSAYLPAWLASNMLSHLPNLMEVTMVDIPNCSNLPPFGVLPNLQRLVLKRVTKVIRIDADHLGGDSKAAFRRPLHVTLDGMLNLEEIDTYSCHDRFEFPTLDELVINKCPKLRFGDNPPPKARMLVISDCDQLMVSPVEKRGEHVEDPSSSTCTTSAPVTEVVIESCKMPLSELKWSLLEGLAPLHSLHIRNCSEKIISPEIMKDCLSSLQLLCFSHCVNMTYLPEHVVQDTSLKELVIDECRGIKSLPQSVYEERNKHYPLLRIRDCPELKKWCELEENKTKLAHIEIIFEESGTSEPETTTHGKYT